MSNHSSSPALSAVGLKLIFSSVVVVMPVLWWQNIGSISELYQRYFAEALTMVLGAFVAGSTPLGGGAVAFPVLTKWLEYTPSDARIFSVLIQSVGMTCASLLFITLRIQLYWREITIGLIASVILPHLLMEVINVNGSLTSSLFVIFEIIALSIITFSKMFREYVLPLKENTALILFAFIGGLFTVNIGTGADLMLFIYLVFVLKIAPVKAIPSCVVFMALNAIFSAVILVMTDSITIEMSHAWLAAAPVAAIMAPFGGWLLGYVHPKLVIIFISSLIIIDLVFSLFAESVSDIEKSIICIGLLLFLYIVLKHFTGRSQKLEV